MGTRTKEYLSFTVFRCLKADRFEKLELKLMSYYDELLCSSSKAASGTKSDPTCFKRHGRKAALDFVLIRQLI